MTFYYMLWITGFKPPLEFGGNIWTDTKNNSSKFFPARMRLKNTYYEYRDKTSNLIK